MSGRASAVKKFQLNFINDFERAKEWLISGGLKKGIKVHLKVSCYNCCQCVFTSQGRNFMCV